MLKIGITGQSGFIGAHLYSTIGLFPQKYTRIPFEDRYFDDNSQLRGFVASCDVIVHLAAINRHINPDVIYNTNISLVNKLIEACEFSHSNPHILFSSSTQEERDNLYGRSKREGRELFENWARRSGSRFTGLVIPNVFGPFGYPYYNSVVATFCYQLTHNEMPQIEIDGDLKIIYIADLVSSILYKIDGNSDFNKIERFEIPYTSTIKVAKLLEKLNRFKNQYFDDGVIPNLSDTLDRNLYNTLLTYIDHNSFFPFILKKNTDERGFFVEAIKLNSGGQVSFSMTKPGITRGNHFHTRKAERFIVIKGKAAIEFRRIGTKDKFTFVLDGEKPSLVDMPVWFTHNITNVGSDDLYTIFWISEQFDSLDSDTFFEQV